MRRATSGECGRASAVEERNGRRIGDVYSAVWARSVSPRRRSSPPLTMMLALFGRVKRMWCQEMTDGGRAEDKYAPCGAGFGVGGVRCYHRLGGTATVNIPFFPES